LIGSIDEYQVVPDRKHSLDATRLVWLKPEKGKIEYAAALKKPNWPRFEAEQEKDKYEVR
jgi:hypothetical protein